MGQRLAVAMSGGVDSAVAAFLLAQQGYDLTGITLRMHTCAGAGEAEQAAHIARQLGFDHRSVDMTDRFRCQVMDDFAAAYEQGRTPNPCIRCNRYIKFGALVELAGQLGCAGVATGPYK